jgi:hypothetical protein
MRRRGVIVATLAAVLIVLAASSGPVRVWTTPTPGVGPSTVDTLDPREISPAEPVINDSTASSRFSSAPLQIVAVLIVLAAVFTLAVFGGSWRPNWRRRLRMPRHREIDALPEPEHGLVVDIDAARAALAAGEPRNAIVACWMQLERDAAEAGLERTKAETSAEYAERVVALSSVDAIPIGELAALYREARFSRHDMNDDHRSRAFTALDRVVAALRRGVKVST